MAGWRPAVTSSVSVKPSDTLTLPPRVCLGFDFGLRRIGIAIGNTAGGSARPLLTLHNRASGSIDWTTIERLLADWRVDQLVVGLPERDDGADGALTPRVRRFARQLEGRFQLPVALVSEHLSSVEAEQLLATGPTPATRRQRTRRTTRPRVREELDTMAAVVILQTWLSDHSAAGADR